MAILTLGFLSLPDLAPAEVVAAAVAGGFRSVGLRITGRLIGDAFPAVVGHPAAVRDLRQRLADNGIALSNIAAYHLRPGVGLAAYEPVLETAARLGARNLIANGYDPDLPRFCDLLGNLGAAAHAHGLTIALETVPYSEVKTLALADQIVTGCGAATVGHLLDTLHLARSGGTPADIAQIAPGRIVYAQLCDAPALLPDGVELATEARSGRLYPGEGGLPVAAFLAALPAGLEIEVELPCAAESHLPGAERARRLKQRMTEYLASQGRTFEP